MNTLGGDIWSTGAFSFESPLRDLLDGGDYTIEQLLSEDELLQEIRGIHHELIEYISKPESITKLIGYIIMGTDTIVQKNKHKNKKKKKKRQKVKETKKKKTTTIAGADNDDDNYMQQQYHQPTAVPFLPSSPGPPPPPPRRRPVEDIEDEQQPAPPPRRPSNDANNNKDVNPSPKNGLNLPSLQPQNQEQPQDRHADGQEMNNREKATECNDKDNESASSSPSASTSDNAAVTAAPTQQLLPDSEQQKLEQQLKLDNDHPPPPPPDDAEVEAEVKAEPEVEDDADAGTGGDGDKGDAAVDTAAAADTAAAIQEENEDDDDNDDDEEDEEDEDEEDDDDADDEEEDASLLLRRIRFPYMATEVICCDVQSIIDAIVDGYVVVNNYNNDNNSNNSEDGNDEDSDGNNNNSSTQNNNKHDGDVMIRKLVSNVVEHRRRLRTTERRRRKRRRHQPTTTTTTTTTTIGDDQTGKNPQDIVNIDSDDHPSDKEDDDDDISQLRVLDLFFSVLYTTGPGELDDYRAGYFDKVLSVLFRKRPDELSNYVNTGGNYFFNNNHLLLDKLDAANAAAPAPADGTAITTTTTKPSSLPGLGRHPPIAVDALMRATFSHLNSHSIMQIAQRLLLPARPTASNQQQQEQQSDEGASREGEEDDDGNLISGGAMITEGDDGGGGGADDGDENVAGDGMIRCDWSKSGHALNLLLENLFSEEEEEDGEDDVCVDDDADVDAEDEAMSEERDLDRALNASEVLVTMIQNSMLTSSTILTLTSYDTMSRLVDAATILRPRPQVTNSKSRRRRRRPLPSDQEKAEQEQPPPPEYFSPHESLLTAAMNVLESLILQLGGYGAIGTMSLIPEMDEDQIDNNAEANETNSNDGDDEHGENDSSNNNDEGPMVQGNNANAALIANLSSLLSHLPTLLSRFSGLLRHPSTATWMSPTQFSRSNPVAMLGNSRLRIVRVLESLVLLGDAEVDAELVDSSCLSICLDLFWEFQWCSMLHQSVANLLVHVFEGQNARYEMQEYFLVRCNLLGRLMDSFVGSGGGGAERGVAVGVVDDEDDNVQRQASNEDVGDAAVADSGSEEEEEEKDKIPVSEDDVDAALEKQEAEAGNADESGGDDEHDEAGNGDDGGGNQVDALAVLDNQDAADVGQAPKDITPLYSPEDEEAIAAVADAVAAAVMSAAAGGRIGVGMMGDDEDGTASRMESTDMTGPITTMTTAATTSQSFRYGYMGHVIIICQALVHACAAAAPDQQEQEEQQDDQGSQQMQLLQQEQQQDENDVGDQVESESDTRPKLMMMNGEKGPEHDDEDGVGDNSNNETASNEQLQHQQEPLLLVELVLSHPLADRWNDFVGTTLATETAIQSTPLGGYNVPSMSIQQSLSDSAHHHHQRPGPDDGDAGIGDRGGVDDDGGGPPLGPPPRGMLGGGDVIDMDDSDLDMAAAMMAGMNLGRPGAPVGVFDGGGSGDESSGDSGDSERSYNSGETAHSGGGYAFDDPLGKTSGLGIELGKLTQYTDTRRTTTTRVSSASGANPQGREEDDGGDQEEDEDDSSSDEEPESRPTNDGDVPVMDLFAGNFSYGTNVTSSTDAHDDDHDNPSQAEEWSNFATFENLGTTASEAAASDARQQQQGWSDFANFDNAGEDDFGAFATTSASSSKTSEADDTADNNNATTEPSPDVPSTTPEFDDLGGDFKATSESIDDIFGKPDRIALLEEDNKDKDEDNSGPTWDGCWAGTGAPAATSGEASFTNDAREASSIDVEPNLTRVRSDDDDDFGEFSSANSPFRQSPDDILGTAASESAAVETEANTATTETITLTPFPPVVTATASHEADGVIEVVSPSHGATVSVEGGEEPPDEILAVRSADDMDEVVEDGPERSPKQQHVVAIEDQEREDGVTVVEAHLNGEKKLH